MHRRFDQKEEPCVSIFSEEDRVNSIGIAYRFIIRWELVGLSFFQMEVKNVGEPTSHLRHEPTFQWSMHGRRPSTETLRVAPKGQTSPYAR